MRLKCCPCVSGYWQNHGLQLRAFALAIEQSKAAAAPDQGSNAVEGELGPEQVLMEDEPQKSSEDCSTGGGEGAKADVPAGKADAKPVKADASGSGQKAQSGGGWFGAARNLLSIRGGARAADKASGAASEAKDHDRDRGVEAGAAELQRDPLEGVRLKLVGGSRSREDEYRILMLTALAEQLGIASRVDLCVNVPYG